MQYSEDPTINAWHQCDRLIAPCDMYSYNYIPRKDGSGRYDAIDKSEEQIRKEWKKNNP